MKYQSKHLRQMLAGQYVLGTLRGRARARFERLLRNDVALQGEVSHWERRLAPLAARITPQAPREIVWTQIDRSININKVTALAAVPAPTGALNLWRGWAMVSTAASVLLAAGLWQELQRGPQIIEVPKIITVQAPAKPMPYVALLQPDKSGARWKVSLYPDRATMKIAVSGQYAMTKPQSLELWVLEAAGPRSLGVLPMHGEMEMPLPKAMPVKGDMTLAVSLEPMGGSPTGQPTGPVILSAPAVQAL